MYHVNGLSIAARFEIVSLGMTPALRTSLLFGVIFLLVALEIAAVYFIMPFPGSQQFDTVEFAYALDRYGVYLRVMLFGALAGLVLYSVRKGMRVPRITLAIALVLYVALFIGIRTMMTAEAMFLEPGVKRFIAGVKDTAQLDKVIIGVAINGEARAYPIQILGYHHQVRDTVGAQPLLVTYCTVCRTGRVYSQTLNGKAERFRLVGMDHFNAMFEDATTRSWWQQATGECVAGPLKGMYLTDIPSQQVTLRAWLREHPNSTVLQPDPGFLEQYAYLKSYESGLSASSLVRRDTASWQFKSWVIGIRIGDSAHTYDWSSLERSRTLHDELAGTPLVVIMESDRRSFHAFVTRVGSETLRFRVRNDSTLIDEATGSTWTTSGKCIDGVLKGTQLKRIQAHQEYLHSWEQFNPGAKRVVTREM